MNRCNRIVRTTGITVGGSFVRLLVPYPVDGVDLSLLKLIICQEFPNNADSLPVLIEFSNGTTIPVNNKNGNVLRADQIRCSRVYVFDLDLDPVHYTILNCVCPTRHIIDLSVLSNDD